MSFQKRILVVNPNTQERTTRDIEETCRKIVFSGTHVDAVSPPVSSSFDIPAVLSWTDEYLTALEVVRIIRRKCKEYDGAIIACFSDPGLDAARELFDIPILGIAETSYFMACMLGHKFSILCSTTKWTPPKERRLRALGISSRVASVRSYTKSSQEDYETRKKLLASAGKKAVEEDGAEVVILGGAAYVGIAKELEWEIGVPVIDPTSVTLKTMESLIHLGLSQSKKGMWSKPVDEIRGMKYVRPI